MDAADHRIDYLSSTHRPRNDLVYGAQLRKNPRSLLGGDLICQGM